MSTSGVERTHRVLQFNEARIAHAGRERPTCVFVTLNGAEQHLSSRRGIMDETVGADYVDYWGWVGRTVPATGEVQGTAIKTKRERERERERERDEHQLRNGNCRLS